MIVNILFFIYANKAITYTSFYFRGAKVRLFEGITYLFYF